MHHVIAQTIHAGSLVTEQQPVTEQSVFAPADNDQTPTAILDQIIYVDQEAVQVVPIVRDQIVHVGRQQGTSPTWYSFTALDWHAFTAQQWGNFSAAEPILPSSREPIIDQCISVRPITTTTITPVIDQSIYSEAA